MPAHDPPPTPLQPEAGRPTWLLVLLGLCIVALVALMHLQAAAFDGLRAFVRAEGLWAKAQKDAVLYLTRFVHSRDDSDYAAFLHATTVSLGDRDARTTLLSDSPDLARARQGLLEGQNHPEDIDSMVWFFQNFQWHEAMQRAIAIWTQGDEKMQELMALGEDIRQAVRLGVPAASLGAQLQRIDTLNQELLLLENSFSHVLGEAARGLRRALTVLSLGLLLVLGLAMAWGWRRWVPAAAPSIGR